MIVKLSDFCWAKSWIGGFAVMGQKIHIAPCLTTFITKIKQIAFAFWGDDGHGIDKRPLIINKALYFGLDGIVLISNQHNAIVFDN